MDTSGPRIIRTGEVSGRIAPGPARYRPRMRGLHVLDRVGSDDGFAAGLIHGLLTGAPVERALAYGTAHGALVMTTPGDASTASLAEVEALIADGSAHVGR